MAKWIALAYRLPAEPSAPRVAVWRALQRLEGEYLQDGLFLVESSDLTAIVLANLAHDVRNYGGEASVLEVSKVDDERHLAARLKVSAKAPRASTKRAKAPSRRRGARS